MKRLISVLGLFFLISGTLLIWKNPFLVNPGKFVVLLLGIFSIYASIIMILTVFEKSWANSLLRFITPYGKFETIIDYVFMISKTYIKGILLPFIMIFGFWVWIFVFSFILPNHFFNKELLTFKSSVFLSLTLGTLIFTEFGNLIISKFANPKGIKKEDLNNEMYLYLYWSDVKTEELSLKIINQQRLLFVVYVFYLIFLCISTFIKYQYNTDSDFIVMIMASFSIIIAYDRLKGKMDLIKKNASNQSSRPPRQLN